MQPAQNILFPLRCWERKFPVLLSQSIGKVFKVTNKMQTI